MDLAGKRTRGEVRHLWPQGSSSPISGGMLGERGLTGVSGVFSGWVEEGSN